MTTRRGGSSKTFASFRAVRQLPRQKSARQNASACTRGCANLTRDRTRRSRLGRRAKSIVFVRWEIVESLTRNIAEGYSSRGALRNVHTMHRLFLSCRSKPILVSLGFGRNVFSRITLFDEKKIHFFIQRFMLRKKNCSKAFS